MKVEVQTWLILKGTRENHLRNRMQETGIPFINLPHKIQLLFPSESQHILPLRKTYLEEQTMNMILAGSMEQQHETGLSIVFVSKELEVILCDPSLFFCGQCSGEDHQPLMMDILLFCASMADLPPLICGIFITYMCSFYYATINCRSLGHILTSVDFAYFYYNV